MAIYDVDNIKTVTYCEDNDGNLRSIRVLTNDDRTVFVPIDKANTCYQKVLAWVANGGKPEIEQINMS